jgi:hypothetical protein
MLRRSAALFAVAASIASVGFAGCGKKSSSSSSKAPSTTNLAKTKFLIHAGLAFGAFDHFIYRPFTSGGFGGPQSRKLAVTQAAPATLFIHSDLMLAAADVKSSRDLQGLFAPLTAVANAILPLRTQFLRGRYNPADINSIHASLARVKSSSAAAGAPIQGKFVRGEQPTGAITATP